jgi:hypothetical protein
LSDSFETHVSGAYVHAGSGDFYVQQVRSRGRDPRKTPADEMRWLERRFVEPAGLGEARDVLESFRTVLLDGPEGGGRVAAAQMLLWELKKDSGQLHEVVLQDEENASRIDHGHVGDGDGVWLDLSQIDASLWAEVHVELSSLRATIIRRDAHLVVVLPATMDNLRSTLIQYRVELQRPPLDEVLFRYLLAEDVPYARDHPPSPFLNGQGRIEQVQPYVDLIVRAREKDPKSDLRGWCETALQALSGQEQDVGALVAGLDEGPQRAFLFAAAMLHGAHADVVHRAGASLLETVEHPQGESPMLVHTPLDLRLQEIGAELDSSGSVRFRKLDYDAAVRSYFWMYMPQLRGPIQEWVRQTADATVLTDHERANLVTRFAERCLDERYLPTLVTLVNQWTANPTSARKVEAATLTLQRGLQDDNHGRFFRRQIYDWSRTPNIPGPLAEVIIVTCREEMMAKHPDEALVRLHHVARRERGTRARETLIELVRGASRFRRQMLHRLTDPKFEPDRWPVDGHLFLELADPSALTAPERRGISLITDGAVRPQLSAGWRLAFALHPHETWGPHARRWLDTAAGSEQYRHALLDVLVDGGRQDTSVLARLYLHLRTVFQVEGGRAVPEVVQPDRRQSGFEGEHCVSVLQLPTADRRTPPPFPDATPDRRIRHRLRLHPGRRIRGRHRVRRRLRRPLDTV